MTDATPPPASGETKIPSSSGAATQPSGKLEYSLGASGLDGAASSPAADEELFKAIPFRHSDGTTEGRASWAQLAACIRTGRTNLLGRLKQTQDAYRAHNRDVIAAKYASVADYIKAVVFDVATVKVQHPVHPVWVLMITLFALLAVCSEGGRRQVTGAAVRRGQGGAGC